MGVMKPTHLTINPHSFNEEKEEEYSHQNHPNHHQRGKSPLTPIKDWFSHKNGNKKSKKSKNTKRNKRMSEPYIKSNNYEYDPKYKTNNKSKLKCSTPTNLESNSKKEHKKKSSNNFLSQTPTSHDPPRDHQNQLKFTKKLDKKNNSSSDIKISKFFTKILQKKKKE